MFESEKQRIMSCEALLRWPHPERGMVSPAEFIRVAEEMGLIVEIGNRSCTRPASNAGAGRAIPRVAVNLSSIQFSRSNVPALDARDTRGDRDLPPHRLEIEITESTLLQDTSKTRAGLRQLEELGVRVSLDDFGTGVFESQLPAQLPAAQGEDRPVVPAGPRREFAPGDLAARHGAAQRGTGTARHRRRASRPRSNSN